MTEKVMAWTNHHTGEKEYGFRSSRGCADQVSAMKNLLKKYFEERTDFDLIFMDLEKAYDMVDRDIFWKVL